MSMSPKQDKIQVTPKPFCSESAKQQAKKLQRWPIQTSETV